jgi:hypothetical protein
MGLNDEPGPQRDLPAAYKSPFRALGEDLRAVLATLKLRCRELWRRNREGDLPIPRFWPARLGPLFWPVVLALALATLTALPIWVSRRIEVVTLSPVTPAAEEAQPSPAVPNPPVSRSDAWREEPPPSPPAEPPEPAPLELDPLLALISQQDPHHLIASVHPQPAISLLELELSEAFVELPADQGLQEAQRWLERSLELGYEQLVLVDDAGRVLGRQARVGSGMILLDAAVPS